MRGREGGGDRGGDRGRGGLHAGSIRKKKKKGECKYLGAFVLVGILAVPLVQLRLGFRV